MARGARTPKLAVWKFSSCDGCQLTLLDCEDILLELAEKVRIAYFPEATRGVVAGPYDLSLVEGSISTQAEAERIHRIRRMSRTLVAIGACATSGGIQALRNSEDLERLIRGVYARREAIDSLPRSTRIGDHVAVDHEVRGCPVAADQLVEVVSAVVHGRTPNLTDAPVCAECKRNGNVCVQVAHGTPCLGPVTAGGCGALCPRFDRGCYGCFGPYVAANTSALATHMRDALAVPSDAIARSFRGIQCGAEAFRKEADRHER